MDEALNQLLEAELEAERIVAESEEQREGMKQQALRDAHAAITQFQARAPEIRDSFMAKAQERADQSISELQLRYQERCDQLCNLSDRHYQEALDAALELLLDLRE